MKSITKLSTLFVVIAFAFASCSKVTNSSSTSTIIQKGDWKVILFSESGNDHTSNYSAYSFTFNSDGTLDAVKSGATSSGTWNTGSDDSQQKLYINFAGSNLSELNSDWHIIEKTTTLIKLEDVSGGNGGTDYLTFSKN